MTMKPHTHDGYSSGHPWYYYLGGSVLTLKQIKQATKANGYQGYLREEIAVASVKGEPTRSMALRAIRGRVITDIKRDISIYRKCALLLHRARKRNIKPNTSRSCDDIHVSMSLKHNHLVNGFAHLIYLDECLAQQADLFG